MNTQITKPSAGKMLTKFLKEVGNEDTTIVVDNKVHVVTRAEALARELWAMATGGTVEHYTPDGTVEIKHYKADKKVAELIFNRIEGKPDSGTTQRKPTTSQVKPERFTPGTKNRLNQFDEQDTDNNEAGIS